MMLTVLLLLGEFSMYIVVFGNIHICFISQHKCIQWQKIIISNLPVIAPLLMAKPAVSQEVKGKCVTLKTYLSNAKD